MFENMNLEEKKSSRLQPKPFICLVYCLFALDIVTCMALDKAGLGDHLITGSRDTTCAIWKFTAIVRRTTILHKILHFNSCVVGFFFICRAFKGFHFKLFMDMTVR